MPLIVNDMTIKAVDFNGNDLKKVFCDDYQIWSKAVDTPITFSPSSGSKGNGSSNFWPYEYTAPTIYSGIDLSLYKGVQFYVNHAYINVNFNQKDTYLSVEAYNSEGTKIGSTTIAYKYRNSEGTSSTTSYDGKTLTINFTQDTGIGYLKVAAHGGSTTDKLEWTLSKGILLAR